MVIRSRRSDLQKGIFNGTNYNCKYKDKQGKHKEAVRIGNEAADEINGRTKVGYTVYSSYYNGITGNNDNLKSIYFAAIGGYNNNAKTSKLNSDANFLKQNEWKTVVINDEDFIGIVVSR